MAKNGTSRYGRISESLFQDLLCFSFFQYFAPRFAEFLKHRFVGRWSQFFIHVYVTFVFIS